MEQNYYEHQLAKKLTKIFPEEVFNAGLRLDQIPIGLNNLFGEDQRNYDQLSKRQYELLSKALDVYSEYLLPLPFERINKAAWFLYYRQLLPSEQVLLYENFIDQYVLNVINQLSVKEFKGLPLPLLLVTQKALSFLYDNFQAVYRDKSKESENLRSLLKNVENIKGNYSKIYVLSNKVEIEGINHIYSDFYGFSTRPDNLITKISLLLEKDVSSCFELLRILKVDDNISEGLNWLDKEYGIKDANIKLSLESLVELLSSNYHNYFQVEIPDRIQILPIPKAMEGLFPGAALVVVNKYADDSTNLYFFNPRNSYNAISLLHLTIHEVFGHAAQMANIDPRKSLLWNPPIYTRCPITEGFAVSMENLAQEIWLQDEDFSYKFKELMKLEANGNFIYAYQLQMMVFRIIRWLRALFDLEVTLGHVSLKEFYEKYSMITTLSPDYIASKTFSFLKNPLYALTYGYGYLYLQSLQKKTKMPNSTFYEKVITLGFPHLKIYDKCFPL